MRDVGETRRGMGTRPFRGRGIVGLGEAGAVAIAASDQVDRFARPLQGAVRSVLSGPMQGTKNFLNGTWFGHPLHPALTDVPLGAWSAALIFDALTATGVADLDRAARASIAVGAAGAVGAALTGLADWADTGKEQRRVGLVHAALNSAALGLQVASLIGRGRGRPGAKVLSLVAFATASSAAYLGGQLVYRLGTQVDRTAWTRGLRTFTPAMEVGDLPSEQPFRKEVDGVPVLLVNHQERIYAMEDTCGHAGCALSGGRLEGDAIACPCHGSTYRLADGAVLRGPSPFPQRMFDVRVEAGLISLRRRPQGAAQRPPSTGPTIRPPSGPTHDQAMHP